MSKFMHKDCWLSDHIDSYLIHLKYGGYSNQVLQTYAKVLVGFALFAREQGVEQTDQLREWAETFAEHESNPAPKESAYKIITDFIGYLQKTGFLPKAKTKARPFSTTLSEYEAFLREIRGLKRNTVADRVSYCGKFLRYLRDSGVTRVRSINQDLIARFIVAEGSGYARKTMVDNCSILRRFLSYLHSKGRIRTDLSAVIVVPRLYKHERCPRFLNRAEIEHVLDSIDRSSAAGKRDYAMLLLLATYGLRSAEVVHLSLDDIDWRTNRLYIRKRKPGNSSVYPLSSTVGDAIIDYLQKGRPQKDYRPLFLSHNVPHKPFKRPRVVAEAVKRYMRLAGFDVIGIGAHIFRYSCAQRLFEDDFRLKVIGDYLGHRDLDTTRRYMKIDIKHLREVALNDGEDLL
jgi:site-specific recombinase XerD